MNKKVLNLAVASALCFAPLSHAAQDTSGMQYTSAAEGFYASIRARLSTESTKDGGAGIENSSSRFGVRGTNDLGNGLKGFYQYEAGVSIDNGGGLSTRVGQVGLEGAFGRVWAGSGWTETYNMTYGSTDIANTGSGALVYSAHGGMRPGRASNMIQYRTPDISGFQAALGVNIKSGSDNDLFPESKSDRQVGLIETMLRSVHATATVSHDSHFAVGIDQPYSGHSDDDDVEMWSLAAKYSVQGFTGAFSYSVRPDTEYGVVTGSLNMNAPLPAGVSQNVLDANGNDTGYDRVVYEETTTRMKEDATAWTARFGYAQDNWYVNGWYGKNNNSDLGKTEDTKFVSMAGGVSVGKVNLYGVWEQSDTGTKEDATTVLGVQYNLGSRSRVWMDYVGKDLDSNAKAEDSVKIGLRHDF